MKNKIIFTILVLLIFIFSGCMGPQRTEVVEPHQGTQGLTMTFMEKSPPGEVYIQDIFPLSVEMNNLGAYDIEDGVFALGVEREYVEILTDEFKDKQVRFSLTGRSIYDPIGGMDRKTISLQAKDLDPQSETHTTIVALTACYPYKTEAAANVCVDTDILGQRQAEKVCTPKTIGMGTVDRDGQSLPQGQGAPIAITKIEQKMLQHENPELIKPQYLIYVSNMGGGLPVDVGVYENACKSTGISKNSLNVLTANVYLRDRSLQLDCKPKFISNSTDRTGYLRLEKNEDFIKCTLEEGIRKIEGTYTTPLMIDLDYGYTFTISKNVLIRKQV